MNDSCFGIIFFHLKNSCAKWTDSFSTGLFLFYSGRERESQFLGDDDDDDDDDDDVGRLILVLLDLKRNIAHFVFFVCGLREDQLLRCMLYILLLGSLDEPSILIPFFSFDLMRTR